MVSSLIWGTVATRLDISWITSRLSQFCVDSIVRHRNAVIRVLWYIFGTLQFAIILGRLYQPDQNLVGYSNADYRGAYNKHSVSATLFILVSGPIS